MIATRSGVARRLAYTIMLRVGITYPRILLGLIVTDFLLTFVVPSGIARVVIMAAIALGLVEAFGAARGSNVARGMFLILTYTANIFDKMIIAGAGSITARGLIEKVGGISVTPVIFPPGRFKLATIPSATGSLPAANTMGISGAELVARTTFASAYG